MCASWHKSIVGVLVAIMISGCAGSHSAQPDNSSVICLDVDLGNHNDLFSLREYVDKCELIPLKLNNDAVIGKIDQLIITDSFMIVNDSRLSDQIYAFDLNGCFSHFIGRKGRGPGEYIQPTDLAILDSVAVVMDMYSHKFLYYELSGKHLKDMSYRNKYHEIESDGKRLFAYAGDNRHNRKIKDYEFLCLNGYGDVYEAALYNKDRLNYNVGYNIIGIDGNVYLSRALVPSVYCYDAGRGLYEKYRLNFSPDPLPSDFERNCKGDFVYFIDNYRNQHSCFAGNFWETERYIGFKAENKGQPYLVMYDKEDKAFEIGKVGVLVDGNNKQMTDVVHLLPLGLNNLVTVRNDVLYCVLDANDLALYNLDNECGANHIVVRIFLK